MVNNKHVPPPRGGVPPSRKKKELTGREKLHSLFLDKKEEEIVTPSSPVTNEETASGPSPSLKNEVVTKVPFEQEKKEDEMVSTVSSPATKSILGIDKRKVLIGAICLAGVLLCIILVTTPFGKSLSPKDVVDTYMKCYIDNNHKEGITKCCLDETSAEAAYTQAINQDMLINVTEYEIAKEDLQGDDNAVVDVKCKQNDDMDYVFKFFMVKNKNGDWKIKNSQALFLSPKSAVDFAMKCLVIQDYATYAQFLYVDEDKPEYEQTSEINMAANTTQKMYSENPVTEYEILNVDDQGDGKTVVEVKIKQKDGKESISKMNMVKNRNGEWKIKASDG
ncbi:MAG: DUF4878 domain-containing protein [Prevotella sp.]|nr:DUF4878 domain-containing protein [Prevotella sp.]